MAERDTRTIYAYGAETLAKINQMKVLIIGMRGVSLF
jgi:tRNA A37 threonylcarbamoyladenosine dehydratase